MADRMRYVCNRASPWLLGLVLAGCGDDHPMPDGNGNRSEEHTSELQSQSNLVCRLLLEKKQTAADLDLIVVDDASTDESQAVALRWLEENAGRFNRAVLIRNTRNSGLGFSRNVAFANS